ncbi:hypothetical protein U9M48_013010 [Paspalum notatum var. saurae]|uniref:Uncharacterized protein n=1 Tax=Paspalum notatum var. saurae TaxID=547442 RepID=A0AAQ3WJ65_PASNO
MGAWRRPYIAGHAAAVAPDRVAVLTRRPHRSATQGNGEKGKLENVFSPHLMSDYALEMPEHHIRVYNMPILRMLVLSRKCFKGGGNALELSCPPHLHLVWGSTFFSTIPSTGGKSGFEKRWSSHLKHLYKGLLMEHHLLLSWPHWSLSRYPPEDVDTDPHRAARLLGGFDPTLLTHLGRRYDSFTKLVDAAIDMEHRLRQAHEDQRRKRLASTPPSSSSQQQREVAFLGHILSEKGVAVDPSNVEDVLNWKKPQTVTEIRSFLGLVGYYRRFIKDFSKIAKPMTSLTQKNPKFVWSPKCEEAFQTLKKLLTSAPILDQPDITKPFDVYCDASDEIIETQKKDKGMAHIREGIDEKKKACFKLDEEGVLWFKNRLVVPKDMELRKKILDEAHTSMFTMHPGSNKMYQDLKQKFLWTRMKREIAKYVSECDICQRVKADHLKPAGERVTFSPDLVTQAKEQVKFIHSNLKRAQSRQKSYSDKRRRPLVFEKDDHVDLRVSPMKGVHRFGVKGKLAPRYVGSFKITEQCGPVAYRLELPPHLVVVHDVFHVSQLKKCLRLPEKVVDTSQTQPKYCNTFIEKVVGLAILNNIGDHKRDL